MTDDEAYAAAAQAMLPYADQGPDELFEWHRCPECPTDGACACSGVPWPSAAVRAAVDAAVRPSTTRGGHPR